MTFGIQHADIGGEMDVIASGKTTEQATYKNTVFEPDVTNPYFSGGFTIHPLMLDKINKLNVYPEVADRLPYICVQILPKTNL